MTAEEMQVDQPYTPGPAAVDLTPDKDGGVLKEIKQAGTGDACPPLGSSVSVHYVGTLADGSKFDSSRDRGEKFEFTLGKGNVIKAWDLGVATMKKGEVAVLYCKAAYAYGENGSPPKIPPNATLIFEVELFDWKLEDISKKKDGGILRQILKSGSGYSSPNEEALVEISLIGRHGDRVFDERELSFNLGEGCEHCIPDGVEQALLKFKKQERSILHLSPAMAFGSKGCDPFGIPANAQVSYEVELKSFEKAKETWSMDADEKLEQAKLCKDKGTNNFKAAKYNLALKQYAKIVSLLEFEKSLKDEQKIQEREQLLLAAHLNQAMCCLKSNDFTSTRDHCNKALEMDDKNEKGLFRLGLALLGMNEPEQAKKKFEAIVAVDATNKAAANQVKVCESKIREERQKEKQLYSSIFNKMAENDRQVSGQWRFGWWDESQRGVHLDVDLDEVEREKAERLAQAKAEKRKENEEFKRRYGGMRPPVPKGLVLPKDDDGEEEEGKKEQPEDVTVDKGAEEQNDGDARTDSVGQQLGTE